MYQLFALCGPEVASTVHDVHRDVEFIATVDLFDPLFMHNHPKTAKDPSMTILSGP
jgi:hypothetical protein